jgi:O-antigen biosynthesis protein
MDLSVCVPVYKAHDAPNVASLAAALPAACGALKGDLVVALNGIDARKAGVPGGVRSVALDTNRGVAPGWNAAAGAAGGDVLVFANDDVEPGPGSLELLARVLRERPEAGVVGPVGTRWDTERWEHREFIELGDRAPGDVEECDVVSGFLFAVRREVYEAAGGFDEAYAPASWEEVDFDQAVRARGLKCYAVAGVEAPHEWGISARQKPWARIRWGGRSELLWSIHRRNRRHFLSKWA